jgi:nucleoporin NUP82
VVDNQIRWSSLSKLKDEWKQQSKAKRDLAMKGTLAENKDDGRSQAHYKVRSQTAHPTRLAADRISS